MNSKLLEEAIIDAEALREAALKNAEQAILEKYAPEVKSAIETLLEQEDDDMAAVGAMPPLGGDMSAQKPEMDVPLAATDGEKLCPCPDEDEVVTISIADLEDAIKKTVANTARANAGPTPEAAPPMDMGMGEPAPEEMMPPEEEELPEEPMMEDIEIDADLIASILSEAEEAEEEEEEDSEEELDEKMSKEDIAALRPPKNKIDAEDLAALRAGQDEEMKNENKILLSKNSNLLVEQKKTLKENMLLAEKLEKLLKQHNKLLEESKQVKSTALELSKRLDEANLMNAKLLYKNQALGSDSLNERQKNKIVEAVSKAGSVDEAKMIYETLCNAVGTFDNKGPQSLSEAVEQKGGFIIKSRQETNSNSNPVHARWQKIAGIKK